MKPVFSDIFAYNVLIVDQSFPSCDISDHGLKVINIFMVELLCELRESPECAVNSAHSFVFLFGKNCIKTTSLIFEGDSWFVYSPQEDSISLYNVETVS